MPELSDTDPKVARMQIEIWRNMTPSRRLQLMASMSEMVIKLSRQSLELKLGDTQAAKLEWIRLNYGEDFARKVQAAL